MSELSVEAILEGASLERSMLEGITFREGMELLESIVRRLESGDLELEDSLRMYASGVTLLSELQERLGSAEQQVEELMGKLEAAPDDDIQDTTLTKA